VSRLQVSNMIGRPTSNWGIEVVGNSYLNYRGAILQTIYRRSDSQVQYSSPVSLNGTTITELELTIVPKRPNSILLCTWMLNAEVHWNNVFVIHRNRQLITTPNYYGYNSFDPYGQYSGYVSAMYDNDNSSTMHNYYIQYAVVAGTTDPTSIAPAVRGSGTIAYTLLLNRTITAPADNNEIAVSTGMIQEIAQ
jgi:hypothetical protein